MATKRELGPKQITLKLTFTIFTAPPVMPAMPISIHQQRISSFLNNNHVAVL